IYDSKESLINSRPDRFLKPVRSNYLLYKNLAEKILKGITCPSCGGELDLMEGVKSFNCKFCGTLLITKGVDGVIKYYVPNCFQRNVAIQNAFNWLGHGLSKARGLKAGSKLDDAFLVYIPYWRVRADVIGWVFGKERR